MSSTTDTDADGCVGLVLIIGFVVLLALLGHTRITQNNRLDELEERVEWLERFIPSDAPLPTPSIPNRAD